MGPLGVSISGDSDKGSLHERSHFWVHDLPGCYILALRSHKKKFRVVIGALNHSST